MKKTFTLLLLMVSLFATAQQNGAAEYMYIHRSNGVVDSVVVAEIDSVTFAIPTVPDAPVTPPAETQYQAVDLGLSVKWATMNVGATKPEEYGDYFAWGETEEKEYYEWSTYKWCNGSDDTMTKYCTDSGYGIVDNKTVLDPEDDVAHVKWGGTWRMPTLNEQKELLNNCTWEWTTQNGVNGYTVTGPNGNSIFLPAAGCRGGAGVYYRGSNGVYWSSSLGSSNRAYYFEINSGSCGWSDYYRYHGQSVRPVCGEAVVPEPVASYTVSVSCVGNGTVAIKDVNGTTATVVDGSKMTVVAVADAGNSFAGWFVGDSEEPLSADAEYSFVVGADVALVARFVAPLYEAVDLGLSVKWATMNVGATSPEEYGGYYAWGETEEKEYYEWSTYKWCNGSSDTMTKYCTRNSYGTVDNKTVLDPEDDVAHVKWGGSWRMPIIAELDELYNNCTWEWTNQNGVNGYKVTGPNGNSIFLPATGFCIGTEVYSGDSVGDYWSSSLRGIDNRSACDLYFDSGYKTSGYYARSYGHCVRPVSE